MRRMITARNRLRVAFAIVAVLCTTIAFAAAPTVSVAVTGTPTPGATVTAKATITITDGSTLQSITWKQTGGVPVTLANQNTDTVTITLPDRATFKADLIEILEELPNAQFNAYVKKPATFEGIQNRFAITGISAHAANDVAAIPFDVTVVTTSGTYTSKQTVTAVTPWQTAAGIRNVPLNVPSCCTA